MTHLLKLSILFFIMTTLISCGGSGGSDSRSNTEEETPLAIEYTNAFGKVKSIPIKKVSNTEYIADISDVDYAENNQIIVTLGSNITKNTNETASTIQSIANLDSTEEQFLSVTYNDENDVLYELRVSGKNNRFEVDITDPLEKGSTKLMFTVSEPVTPEPNPNQVKTSANAASFLNRATFGSTEKSINSLMSEGSYESWLNTQFNLPPTLHTPKIRKLAPKMCIKGNKDNLSYRDPRQQIWWEITVNAEDQLRQRVALALSQILVISDAKGLGLYDFQFSVANYYDILVKHAFGNYRELLEDVTLNPAMGVFLSMIRNQKENNETSVRPDENYAREFLQLFTIGVNELNLDGTSKLDHNGDTIPTYDQQIVEEFAKAFTGWNYDNAGWYSSKADQNHNKPMVPVEKYHDTSGKTLLNESISPSDQTAQADLTFALDNAFNHDNVAPFISKQLIQRLVTSNPTPAYVERVARVFNNNGNDIKGDLQSVIKAILLDEEALAENKPNHFGKLREPLLRISHLWRAFNMQTSLREGFVSSNETCGQESYPYYFFWSSLTRLGKKISQNPLGANSVFNFFRPGFSPNGLLNNQKLVAPEFQLVNENTLTSTNNLLYDTLDFFSNAKAITPQVDEYSKLNLETEVALAQNTDQLLEHLNLILLNNKMSPSLKKVLKEHLDFEDLKKGNPNLSIELKKAREAIFLITSSPEYLIQR